MTRGIYDRRNCGSSAATADSLESIEADSLSGRGTPENTQETLLGMVEIEGMELLPIEDMLSSCSEDNESDCYTYDSEDSLVLARKRLAHIWLGLRRLQNSGVKVWAPTDSVELTKRRLPNLVLDKRRGRRPDTGSTKGEEAEIIPALESINLSSSSSDCSEDSWDDKTGDSVELTRKRFRERRNKEREEQSSGTAPSQSEKTKKQDGTDLLFLTPPKRLLQAQEGNHHKEKTSRPPHVTRLRAFPIRHGSISNGLVKQKRSHARSPHSSRSRMTPSTRAGGAGRSA